VRLICALANWLPLASVMMCGTSLHWAVVDLGGVEAEEDVFGAREDGALQGNDVGLRVPESFGGHTFRTEKSGVELPKLDHFSSAISE
jgi:hypothetical protein